MMELNLTRLDYLQVCETISLSASMETSTARLYEGLSEIFLYITFFSRLELRLPKQ